MSPSAAFYTLNSATKFAEVVTLGTTALVTVGSCSITVYRKEGEAVATRYRPERNISHRVKVRPKSPAAR